MEETTVLDVIVSFCKKGEVENVLVRFGEAEVLVLGALRSVATMVASKVLKEELRSILDVSM